MINSPISKIKFRNTNFLIKRDDLLDSEFSGNKARKFYHLLQGDFSHINNIVSSGSNQSNAMYSLSVLAKIKKWNFSYYVSHIPQYLLENPNGNYKYALENGMKIYEKDTPIENKKDTLYINEGGANYEAKYGLKILADELNSYIKQNNLYDIKVYLPSGTGTTALFLNQFLDVDVLTCACVGSDEYLKQQFSLLQKDENLHPTILKKEKKFHFGKLYKSNWDIYRELKTDTNITFDLLYDPIAWQTLFYNQDKIDINKILYIHQGGLIGNITMIQRYERKYIC
jgi:1-aminocyclopropane-1-carboxylate deaminase/D-cysteine desulfhydrase-like pyridoxal-dependent ACC family enzyme